MKNSVKRDLNALKNRNKKYKKNIISKNKIMIFWNNIYDDDPCSGCGIAITNINDKKKWSDALSKNNVVEYKIKKRDLIFDDYTAESFRDGLIY